MGKIKANIEIQNLEFELLTAKNCESHVAKM